MSIDEPLINAADFKSIVLKVNLTNTTTHAEIRDGKRYYGSGGMAKQGSGSSDENLEISIAEFVEDGLVLEIPSKTCAANHNILVEITSENANPPINFSGTMKVKSHERVSEDMDMIEATFLQMDEQEWKKIQNIFSKRQEEIRNFINSVKGYESA